MVQLSIFLTLELTEIFLLCNFCYTDIYRFLKVIGSLFEGSYISSRAVMNLDSILGAGFGMTENVLCFGSGIAVAPMILLLFDDCLLRFSYNNAVFVHFYETYILL